jgi:hypothetical protein
MMIKTKENEMGEACSSYRGDDKYLKFIFGKQLTGRTAWKK